MVQYKELYFILSVSMEIQLISLIFFQPASELLHRKLEVKNPKKAKNWKGI